MQKHNKTKNGFIAISAILIISVVILAITLTVTYLSIGESQSALAHSKGEDTLQFTEGCMEDALLKIRNSATYAGGTITRPEGSCTVTVFKAGNSYVVTATSTSTLYRRTIRVSATRGNSLVITSWQEI